MDALHDRQGHSRRVRLGRAHGEHHRGLVAERVKAMVSVSGYLIGSQAAGKTPLIPSASTNGGTSFTLPPTAARPATTSTDTTFNKLIWQTASPSWKFDDATFDLSAAAFDNPDHVTIVVHNYRWRLALADGDPNMTIWRTSWHGSSDLGPDHHARG